MGIWCLWCNATAWSVPPDMTDNALRTMCQRGLAESATEYCRAQFNLHIEDDPVRARWAMRHMECQSQSALRSTSTDPNAKWQLVEKIEKRLSARVSGRPALAMAQLASGSLGVTASPTSTRPLVGHAGSHCSARSNAAVGPQSANSGRSSRTRH